MEAPNLDGIGYFLVIAAFLLLGAGFGFCKFINWAQANDTIISKVRIEPELKLTVDNNQIDTLYIYRYEK